MSNYENFKSKIYKLSGINLSSYKERQMKRRIESLMKRNNYASFEEYFKALQSYKEQYEEFINYLTINVSEFYRNPTQWEVLEKEVFPALLKESKNLKIWSAACSTGEEPYSLVMLLSKFMPLNQINILATDIDKMAIERAKTGLYSKKSLNNLPQKFTKEFFTLKGDNYLISDTVKSRVSFKAMNLIEDPYPSGCDLIICRNVMIYFTEETKSEMYQKFHNALKPHGILFVGGTEQIILPNRYKLAPVKTFFYKKIPV